MAAQGPWFGLETIKNIKNKILNKLLLENKHHINTFTVQVKQVSYVMSSLIKYRSSLWMKKEVGVVMHPWSMHNWYIIWLVSSFQTCVGVKLYCKTQGNPIVSCTAFRYHFRPFCGPIRRSRGPFIGQN